MDFLSLHVQYLPSYNLHNILFTKFENKLNYSYLHRLIIITSMYGLDHKISGPTQQTSIEQLEQKTC